MVLAEAGLEPYDGVEEDFEGLLRAYDEGYYEGMKQAITQAARQVLGL